MEIKEEGPDERLKVVRRQTKSFDYTLLCSSIVRSTLEPKSKVAYLFRDSLWLPVSSQRIRGRGRDSSSDDDRGHNLPVVRRSPSTLMSRERQTCVRRTVKVHRSWVKWFESNDEVGTPEVYSLKPFALWKVNNIGQIRNKRYPWELLWRDHESEYRRVEWENVVRIHSVPLSHTIPIGT